MTDAETSVAFIFLYDGDVLTEGVLEILKYIQNVEPISKVAISPNTPQLTHNEKGIIIRPQDLPVFLIAKTGQQTKIEPGTIETAKKIITVLQNMFGAT